MEASLRRFYDLLDAEDVAAGGVFAGAEGEFVALLFFEQLFAEGGLGGDDGDFFFFVDDFEADDARGDETKFGRAGLSWREGNR